MALPKGLSIAGEAIRNTGRGERALYGLLVGAGAALVILGWRVEVLGWATSHPYFIGLLDGATGFCFGVPVAGVVIREASRRASQAAERHAAVRAVIGQLDYIDRLVQGLSPGPIQSAGERLRVLASSARWAAPRASVSVDDAKGGVRIWILDLGGGELTVRPRVEKRIAGQLRGIVEGDKLWASVGFSCGRLASDVTRLVSVLFPPSDHLAEFPGWFDELTSALQAVLVVQLPARRRWLPPAVKDWPVPVPVAIWSLKSDKPEKSDEPEGGLKFWVLSAGSPTKEKTRDAVAAEVKNAVQERVTNELSDELLALAHHLDSLAALADAAAGCRSGLSQEND